jgi:phage baseplate assembly protein W
MSISIKFPLTMPGETNNTSTGIESFDTKEISEAISQNLKFLLLTRPGEYIWDAEFGVGLHNFLFEHFEVFENDLVEKRILEQTASYMPYIDIESIEIVPQEEMLSFFVRIKFYYNGKIIPEVFEIEVA